MTLRTPLVLGGDGLAQALQAGDNIAGADLTQNTVSATYPLAATDRATFIYFANSGLTVNLPATSAVALPVGTRVLFVNLTGGACSIAPLSGVRLFGPSGQKTYSLADNSVATALKMNGDLWVIYGAGLS